MSFLGSVQTNMLIKNKLALKEKDRQNKSLKDELEKTKEELILLKKQHSEFLKKVAKTELVQHNFDEKTANKIVGVNEKGDCMWSIDVEAKRKETEEEAMDKLALKKQDDKEIEDYIDENLLEFIYKDEFEEILNKKLYTTEKFQLPKYVAGGFCVCFVKSIETDLKPYMVSSKDLDKLYITETNLYKAKMYYTYNTANEKFTIKSFSFYINNEIVFDICYNIDNKFVKGFIKYLDQETQKTVTINIKDNYDKETTLYLIHINYDIKQAFGIIYCTYFDYVRNVKRSAAELKRKFKTHVITNISKEE